MNYQELAKQIPRYYSMHEVYQSIWFGGQEIVKGSRDDMRVRMSLIRKEDIKDKVIVDIGCNTGAASFWAIENGAKRCIGFDVAKEGIDFANLIAKELDVKCSFEVQGFGVPVEKKGDIAFCFACVDDITKEDDEIRKILRDNLKKYDVVYFETHLKGTFNNWDMPQIIKEAFNCEYLGETGEGNLKRDLYRLT
jgi:SAM-dependent methyltransferase